MARFYARLLVLTLGALLLVLFAWKGFELALRSFRHDGATQNAPSNPDALKPSNPWQRDVIESIDAARAEAQAGNITAAEMDVDRAASLVQAAALEGRKPTLDFFDMTISALDGALRPHPDNQRLVQHVALARIELAQLRSRMPQPGEKTPPPPKSGLNATNDAAVDPGSGLSDQKSAPTDQNDDDKRVEMPTPKSILANHVFNAATAGGNWIDAKRMPETAEVFLPPANRLLAENVRVQDVTIEGAAQTLDGIHWKNVTFVGTRVRYGSGETDLRNVHFIRCTFGFTTNDRGARLANAIALGQSSIVLN